MVPEVAGSNPVFHPKSEQSRTPKVFGFFGEDAHLGFVNPVQVFVKLTKVVVVKGYVRALAFNQDDRQSGLSINDHRVDL